LKDFYQGDIIKISSLPGTFFVISNNAFIRSTGMFHICPLVQDAPEGALHVPVSGTKGTSGVVICEQIKLIDPEARACSKKDRVSYRDIMEVSDALQAIFEYD